ncbi:hypothetical protein C8K15_10762 [Paenisporosarcina sp. OV554]|nr:hypothetical protein C8K15_10762 [Paenisporosarcina sp. OV554]
MTQSQAHPLYSLDYCAAGKASEVDWKPVTLNIHLQTFPIFLNFMMKTTLNL